MFKVIQIFAYIIIFLSMYIQIFFLVTFLEKRKKIKYHKEKLILNNYPTVTVAVPCWNEEKTVERTINSLLALDYPKDKITIFAVDDGSTDGTWEILQKFKEYSNVKIFKKENGGKHTAVNYVIENSDSEFISCLDADSFVHPETLKRIISYFENDPKTMAVAPAILIDKPKTFIQAVQRVEYEWAVFLKKMMAFVGGIHVTPGPFSVFRKKVFEKIGSFRKAHNTEDMEIAFRMHENHLKIDQCNDAFVYTTGPKNVKALYKQRLRWIYGFIMNTVDYRRMMFKKKFGTFSLLVVPSGFVSIVAVPLLLGLVIFRIANAGVDYATKIKTVGFDFSFSLPNFDWFFMNTEVYLVLALFLYGLIFTTIFLGRKMAIGKYSLSPKILYFMVVFSLIAPFWVLRAIYNSVFTKVTAWR